MTNVVRTDMELLESLENRFATRIEPKLQNLISMIDNFKQMAQGLLDYADEIEKESPSVDKLQSIGERIQSSSDAASEFAKNFDWSSIDFSFDPDLAG